MAAAFWSKSTQTVSLEPRDNGDLIPVIFHVISFQDHQINAKAI